VRNDEKVRNAIQEFVQAKDSMISVQGQLKEAERRVSETSLDLIRVIKLCYPNRRVIHKGKLYTADGDQLRIEDNDDVVID
jgi:hypothetical protein